MQTGGGKRRPATAPDKLWPWPEVLRGDRPMSFFPSLSQEPRLGTSIMSGRFTKAISVPRLQRDSSQGAVRS